MFSDKNGDGLIQQSTTQETSEVTQENHYYPFGLNMEGTWQNTPSVLDNKYQYNGKELNDDFGLGLMDYGARMYDAAIGRFFVKDRFTEKYMNMTPYQYGGNNPIKFIDVNGDSIITVNIVDKTGYIHGKKTLQIDHTMKGALTKFLNNAAANKIHVKLNSAFRTNLKQAGLQSDPNATTPAKPGTSQHNAGVALDFSVFTGNTPKKDKEGNYTNTETPSSDNKLVKDSKQDGWCWGGDFNTSDPVHIDMGLNKSNFNKMRDENQEQMNGGAEVGNNPDYIKRIDTVTIGDSMPNQSLHINIAKIERDKTSVDIKLPIPVFNNK